MVFRGAYTVGLMAQIVASAYAAIVSTIPWFSQAIYEACLMVAVIIALQWLVSEVISRGVKSHSVTLVLGAAALFGTVASSIYVLGAVVHGESTAELYTWHLVSLFAVIHHVTAACLGAGLAFTGVAVYAGAAYLRRVGRPS